VRVLVRVCGLSHVPEHLTLVAQRLQVIDRGGAVGDRHGQFREHPAPVDVRWNPRTVSAFDKAAVSPAL